MGGIALATSGGEVVQKLWVPLDNTDPAPFISQIDPTVDALAGVPTEQVLDALVFATDPPALRIPSP